MARTAASFVFAFVSAVSAVMARSPLSLGAVFSLRKSLNRYAPRISPSIAALEVDVRQRGDDGLDTVQRSRGHACGAANHVGRPFVAILAQPDRQDAGHRERRRDHPGDLLGPTLGAECGQGDLDLADCLGIEERIGDDGRPAPSR